MANVFIAPTFGVGYQSFTNGNQVNAAGYIDTFQAGTSTVTSVYTTSLGTVAHSNPIVLDSAGRIPAGGELWFLGGVAMKLVVKDSTSSAIQTIDNIYGINDPTSINNIGPSGATVSSALQMNGAPINEAQGANIPIVSSVNLQSATGNYLAFTGTGTVTSITLAQGAYRQEFVTNTAAFVNGTTLAMLGGASVTANPGDILGFRGEAAGVVRNVEFWRATGIQMLQPVSANTFLGGLSTGGVSMPTFRTIQLSDLPSSGAVTSSLTGDVNLNNTGNFFDGPSVTTAPVGTWWVSGTVTMDDTGGAAQYIVKLWDGATVIDSGVVFTAATQLICCTLSGFITSPAAALRVSVKDTAAVTGRIRFNASGASKDATISAFRIIP